MLASPQVATAPACAVVGITVTFRNLVPSEELWTLARTQAHAAGLHGATIVIGLSQQHPWPARFAVSVVTAHQQHPVRAYAEEHDVQHAIAKCIARLRERLHTTRERALAS